MPAQRVIIHWTFEQADGTWGCNCGATLSGKEAAQRHEDHPPMETEPVPVVDAIKLETELGHIFRPPPSADVPSF